MLSLTPEIVPCIFYELCKNCLWTVSPLLCCDHLFVFLVSMERVVIGVKHVKKTLECIFFSLG